MASTAYNSASVIIPKGAGYKASTIYGWRPSVNILQSIGITRNDANGSFRNQQGLIEFAAANVPRFNWDEGDRCPKLLVEPSRENLLTYSEEFDNAAWQKILLGAGVAPVVTANAGVAPDGTTTADRVQFDAGGLTSGDQSILRQSYSASSGVSYSITFYIKSNAGAGNQTLGIHFDGGNPLQFVVNENEYTRVQYTGTSVGGSSFGITCKGDTTDQTADVLVWGAQFEEGNYATSYIKTEATTQTRNADVISQTGLASLIGDSEGTLYVEAEVFDTTDNKILSLNDGTLNNRVEIGFLSGGSRYFLTSGGTNQVNILDSYSANTIVKAAFGYSNNDFAAYQDGRQVGTDSSGVTFPDATLSEFKLSAATGITPFYGKISVLAWWQARLSNSVLESLTSYETYEEMAATLDYTID